VPVILPSLGYQEHEKSWRIAAQITYYDACDLEIATGQINHLLAVNSNQHLVVINPNNPSGQKFSACQLQQWADRLTGGGHLIVDEAFIDTASANSVLNQCLSENMIVLRSFGEFFGLAGIRVGFVFASQQVLAFLRERIGPWSVNGPAQMIVTKACYDTEWQAAARIEIDRAASLSRTLFSGLFERLSVTKYRHSDLFSSYWLKGDVAQSVFDFFARRGVLLRCVSVDEDETIVRVGRVNSESSHAVASLKDVIRQAERVFGEHDKLNGAETTNLRKHNA